MVSAAFLQCIFLKRWPSLTKVTRYIVQLHATTPSPDPNACFTECLTFFLVSMSQEDHCTAANEGDIRVIGLTTEDVIVGRMELCYQGVWRAVCAHGWDLNDAKVVCRQMLNLPQSGMAIYIKSTLY